MYVIVYHGCRLFIDSSCVCDCRGSSRLAKEAEVGKKGANVHVHVYTCMLGEGGLHSNL